MVDDYANEEGAGSSGVGLTKGDDVTLEMFCPVFVFTLQKVKRLQRLEKLRLKGATIHDCEHCDYQTGRKGDLHQHTKTHTGEKPYGCRLCALRFSQKSSVTQHVKFYHQDIRDFECDLCDHKAATKQNLAEHRRTHTGNKPYKCNMCTYAATTSSHLVKHKRVHTGEKPYQCDWDTCTFAATSSSDLVKHKRSHTKQKPYSCTLCKYKASQSGTITRHMATHTGVRPFACEYCSHRFTLKGDLRRHLRLKRCKKAPQ